MWTKINILMKKVCVNVACKQALQWQNSIAECVGPLLDLFEWSFPSQSAFGLLRWLTRSSRAGLRSLLTGQCHLRQRTHYSLLHFNTTDWCPVMFQLTMSVSHHFLNLIEGLDAISQGEPHAQCKRPQACHLLCGVLCSYIALSVFAFKK